jgi:hypothetical protein
MEFPGADIPNAAVEVVSDAVLPRGEASTAVKTTVVGIGVPSK